MGTFLSEMPVGYANEVIDENAKRQASKLDGELGGLPVVFSTPETGFAAGGVLIYVPPKLFNRADPVITGVMYTEQNQFLWAIGTRQTVSKSGLALVGYAEVLDYPLRFFGVGADTREENAMIVGEKRHLVQAGVLLPPKFGWQLGINYKYRNDQFTVDDQKKSNLDFTQFRGSEGGVQKGIGFSLVKETTDNVFYPNRGVNIQIGYWDYREDFGTAFPYTYLFVDARSYYKLSKRWISANRVVWRNYRGGVTFYEIPKLGGHDLLRGYFKGRYRDRQLLIAETEARYRLSKSFAAVAFAGLGAVAHETSAFSAKEVLPSYGGGLRYQITPKQKINLRVDIGVGKGDPQFYLYVLEAF